jgi:SAM-dependent methyltransferase
MTDTLYSDEYFSSGVFDQDYDLVAHAIIDAYHPTTILDVGCGPGHLSRALAAGGAQVVATDGYSTPDLPGQQITFRRCNLNSAEQLSAFAAEFVGRFDVAVCLEVAEHLDPKVSDDLVAFLCEHARAVVFSAAVPGQRGQGHINCQPRELWHDRFTRRGFALAHRVRPRLIANSDLAPWYRFNIVDYVASDTPGGPNAETARALLAAESALATEFYRCRDELGHAKSQLRYRPVRLYLSLRTWLKSMIRGR